MSDGILLIDKPEGFTSFDVIAKLRGMSKIRRIGHAGTLDPMATGVLPCLFGTAARLCDIMPCDEKIYQTTVLFGISTDTQDITGKVLSKSDVKITREQLESVLPQFRGDIMQTPPMYSAVSVNGKRLYDLAREGVEVERPSRQITVFSLEMLSFDQAAQTAVFEIKCSRGTYIRTIFHDIGELLGCGAALTKLRRTASSGYSETQCITMEEAQKLTDSGELLSRILPVSTAFETLPKLNVGQWQGKMLSNGVPLSLKKLGKLSEEKYSVWCDGVFLGLGTVDFEESCMRLKKF